MTIEIEKGIELPRTRESNPYLREAMCKMEIGDSILLPRTDTLRGTIYSYAHRVGIKITARHISKTECRVWRVK